MSRQYSRPFVGVKLEDGIKVYEVFRFTGTPTPQTHPQFSYVIGAFKTRRGAEYLASHPHCRNVKAAEIGAEIHFQSQQPNIAADPSNANAIS
jgi:hypothetical protein